jgi:glycogen synthase
LAERTTAAIALYENAKDRKALVKKIMDTDFSWNVSAERYLDMYRGV